MNALTVTREFEWTQTNWLPTARHRNPQSRTLKSVAEIRVPIIDSFDAPVAYVVPTEEYDESINYKRVPGEPRVYRAFNGKLYTVKTTSYAREKPRPVEGTEKWLLNASVGDRWDLSMDTESEAIAKVEDRFAGYIIVNGLVWTPAAEPVYEVKMPNGFFRTADSPVTIDVSSRPNTEHRPADTRFFPADQYPEAVAYARRCAAGGRAKADDLTDTPMIEVTGEHAPGSTWAPATRFTYPNVDAVEWNATVDEWREVMTAFRTSIAALRPDLLLRHDDGFGNTYVTVDTTKLSEDQERDYKYLLVKIEDPTSE